MIRDLQPYKNFVCGGRWNIVACSSQAKYKTIIIYFYYVCLRSFAFASVRMHQKIHMEKWDIINRMFMCVECFDIFSSLNLCILAIFFYGFYLVEFYKLFFLLLKYLYMRKGYAESKCSWDNGKKLFKHINLFCRITSTFLKCLWYSCK